MSFNLDDAVVGGQMKCGTGIFPAIGEGVTRVNGSAGIEGPVVIGSPTHYPFAFAGTNIGPLTNSDALPPFAPGALPLGLSNPYSLMESPNCGVLGNLDVNFRICNNFGAIQTNCFCGFKFNVAFTIITNSNKFNTISL